MATGEWNFRYSLFAQAITISASAMRDQTQIVRTVADLRRLAAGWRKDGASLALVPTMGALHAGHVALCRDARNRATRTIASICVNPTQFGPNEDFARYPRDEAADVAKLGEAGIDAVVFGPGHIEQAHAADEYVEETQLEIAYQTFLAVFAGAALAP